MTDQQIRDIVADGLEPFHGNKEFIQQIRDGLQDTSPWVQGAFLQMNYINEHWMLVPVQESVTDE